MDKNIYKNELLKTFNDLDAIADFDGKISQVAIDLLDNLSDETIKSAYAIISEPSLVMMSAAIKCKCQEARECIIKYIGYQKLKESCDKKNINEENKCLDELINDLDSLIGLENVKQQVKNIISLQKMQLERKKYGLKNSSQTLHMAFIGNPGTGKTSVARIVGKIYNKLGILSKGHFIEASRTDLIAGYQGQTALKVKKLIQSALGGVLFIDEAYSITENDHTDSYGRECLTELTKALEDNRDDLVVIVAGYTKPMNAFFESNPGLLSRFNTFIIFDDYNVQELKMIFNKICKDNDYKITKELDKKIEEYIKKVAENKTDKFSNARLVRNLFDKLVINQARRLSEINEYSKKTLSEFIVKDFEDM